MIKLILILLLSAYNIFPSGEEQTSINLEAEARNYHYPPFANRPAQWADSVMNVMSIEEKIGQLFMIAAYSNRDEAHYQQIDHYIEKYHIGGLIFFQGDPTTQIELTNRYQKLSSVPLLVGIDAEWGLGMRLDNTISYPRQLLLGAIQDDQLVYNMGREIARQHQRMGIHINFAPVVDVNVNPENPVINDRSFGGNRENVAKKGIAYMNGLQDAHVLACAKHFPGHGDTDVDSHYDLPVITHSRSRLDSIELYPFRKLIEAGVSSMMIAHLNIPALDSTLNTPSTLSRSIVSGLLKEEMQFNGLLFTDALNMKGVTKYFEAGESSLRAFLAGNDILLFPDDVNAALNKMKKAYEDGEFSEADLDRSVKKILLAKQWVGLEKVESINIDAIANDLNTHEAQDIRRQLIEAAITVVRDSLEMLPILDLHHKRIASVTIGNRVSTAFTRMLDNYTEVNHFYISKNADWAVFERTLRSLSDYDIVLANIQDMSRYSSNNFGVTANTELFAKKLRRHEHAILTVFGSPYSLEKFSGWQELVVAYEESIDAQELTAQLIFGGRRASGKLPVSAGGYQYGEGVNTMEPVRFSYGSIAELGYDESSFSRVDSIIQATLMIEATPGCQLIVAKDNHVFYNESYGNHTYDGKLRKVSNSDLYDVASITKIMASTPLIMKLVENDRLDLDKTLDEYLNLPATCNKHQLVLKEILAHQSGLWPWIPFYLETLDSNGARISEIYNEDRNDEYPIVVCDDVYCSLVYQDSMLYKIHHSKLRPTKDYKYSDLGFYYMKEIIEQVYQLPIEDLIQEVVYGPMGMNLSTYNPLEAGISLEKIVPTETDILFRGRTIHGYVHDPGAAMMGGVGGHAGVFSNANDLAKYMQMLLNGGSYGGKDYYDPATIDYFTKAHFNNSRRGLGFDKPDPKRRWGSACDSASLSSFGHTGFTGTMAFADPELDLVFIFLSNRVHPSAENMKLIQENSRTQIHQAIYDIFLQNPLKAENQ